MELAIWDKADGSRVMFISRESQNIRREGRGRGHISIWDFFGKDIGSLFSPRAGDWKSSQYCCWDSTGTEPCHTHLLSNSQVIVPRKIFSRRLGRLGCLIFQAPGYIWTMTMLQRYNEEEENMQRRRCFGTITSAFSPLSRPGWECTTVMEQWCTTRCKKRLQIWWREDYR